MQKKRLPTLLDLIHPHLKLYLKIVESKENMSGFLYRFSLIEKEKEAYVNIFKTDKNQDLSFNNPYQLINM